MPTPTHGAARTRAGAILKRIDEFETLVGTIKRRLHVAHQRLKDVMEGNGAVDFQEPSKDGSRKVRVSELIGV